jgi:hypothetical protein
LSALDEAEKAKSSTGGIFHRYVGAITHYDKGNGCLLLRRYSRSGRQRVKAIADCRVGEAIEEDIEADV